jgi:pimeloyl-ACP methyl ester carboxylesterase
LAVWGKKDPFFLPAGAEAFSRDVPGARVHFFETGHFALETHCDEIAAAIRDFGVRSCWRNSAASIAWSIRTFPSPT